MYTKQLMFINFLLFPTIINQPETVHPKISEQSINAFRVL